MNRTLAILFLAACGDAAPPTLPPPARTTSTAPLTACEVSETFGVQHLRATAAGVVFVTDDDGLVAQRFAGVGCALKPDGTPRVAIAELLGADDLGHLYAFPRETRDRDAVSTMLPGGRPDGYVAKVDRGGRVTKLLDAGRGIWSFGVSPSGGALYYVGCDPGGVRPVHGDAMAREPSMGSPQSLWNQFDSVLTDDATFWSRGYRVCGRDGPWTTECGHPLTKTTAAGDTEVAQIDLDFGKGLETPRLASCGARVCGLYGASNTVVVWNADGQVAHTIHPADHGDLATDVIFEISGNAHGVYLLLGGPRGTRVVFVDAP